MPIASVSNDLQHHDLKSLPEGYVKLRRMPYAAWLTRQEMSMKMTVESQGKGRSAGMKGDMAMANRAVTTFEFARCVVEHNLQYENGELMDFKMPSAFEALDTMVGNEIADYIMKLHEFEDGLENLGNGSSTS